MWCVSLPRTALVVAAAAATVTEAEDMDAERKGLIISVSRAVLYASAGIDFANAAATKAQEFDSAIRSALLH